MAIAFVQVSINIKNKSELVKNITLSNDALNMLNRQWGAIGYNQIYRTSPQAIIQSDNLTARVILRLATE
jgi:flagellar biosynthesis/type III secretory pathway chaperone